MSLDEVERSVECLKAFPEESMLCPQKRRKVVGCFGAEPLLHPKFPEIVDIFVSKLPNLWNRGLWTSLDWKRYQHPVYGAARPHVERLIGGRPSGAVYEREKRRHGRNGYLNWNMHTETQTCQHSSVLIGIQEVVADEKRRYEMISQCPYQRDWSPLVGPDADGEVKFFFCEIAQTHSRLFGLNVGIPLSSDCWKGELTFAEDESGVMRPQGKFAHQVVAACNRCSGALPLPGRRDLDFQDDISQGNLDKLQHSPQVQRGEHAVFDVQAYKDDAADNDARPTRYIKS